ncbi:MAG: phenylalanine--tRNA ligase subunit alpha [Candidatus Omnitrophica bacterium]|nr:phenylalanine--tRNA ligase subunit alpha [Candidatus Omnitrophota bacterium]MBU4346069.1 phenylalanine--tRNA ligase subunit alpha [Candidatus Omnitrophota bacterium]MBU4472897.1 phenylalanine--tRNA ligase subunit alpha [Candidatus Omnitrophota bacterium]MCG2706145.1 phenylalanine--tRNA ligase subunit alpha [Candidatus Omnitrophota bacterium]
MSGIDIKTIETSINQEIHQIDSLQGLEAWRLKYLGRKGIIAQLTSSISQLPPEERASFGQKANALKDRITSLIDEKQQSLATDSAPDQVGFGDIHLPGVAQDLGHLHPITQVIDEICGIFLGLGFSIMEGPEIETEYNNFTALNIPLEHPSRDVFDTFYLKTQNPKPKTQNLLLRSHTSPVQVRAMKSRKPPLAIIVPGRVYRPDAVDASHSFMFHQIEGFMVDENITFADLKGVLEIFARGVFGQDIKMRFRPHFFPFTEPSAEVDISCIICKGKGCSICSRKGWLEILGAGMIHPAVFKHVGYKPEKYTGFAFGMGIERIAMLKYGINDIRLFFENDLRFLKQF